jgi:chemotaxis protein MotB
MHTDRLSSRTRPTHRRRWHLTATLAASLLLHAVAATAMLWPGHRDTAGTIEVELGQPLRVPSEAGEPPLLAQPPPPIPSDADPKDLVEKATSASRVDALVAERDALASRLELETRERTTLSEQVAALGVEKQALAEALTDERRRTALREQEQAERTAADHGMHEELLAALRREIDQKDIELRRSREGLAVSIVDRVLFPSGQASLSSDGRAIIDTVADTLKATPEQRIVVEGHTDDVPIGAELARRFPTNWELSTARAAEVVRELTARGVPPRVLEVVGRADTRPAVSNATEAGRRRNRRIELILPGAGSRLDHGAGAVAGADEDHVNDTAWKTQP